MAGGMIVRRAMGYLVVTTMSCAWRESPRKMVRSPSFTMSPMRSTRRSSAVVEHLVPGDRNHDLRTLPWRCRRRWSAQHPARRGCCSRRRRSRRGSVWCRRRRPRRWPNRMALIWASDAAAVSAPIATDSGNGYFAIVFETCSASSMSACAIAAALLIWNAALLCWAMPRVMFSSSPARLTVWFFVDATANCARVKAPRRKISVISASFCS